MLVRALFPVLFTSLVSPPILGQETVSYVSQLHLPLELYTGEGVLLEKGNYDLQLRFEKGHHSLAFLTEERMVAVVNGRTHHEDGAEKWVIPVVGTIFFRSTAEPIGTDEERHYSKTGQAQYEYERRDWKATMRVYKSVNPGDGEIRFVFHETGEGREQTRRDFLLFLDKGQRKNN